MNESHTPGPWEWRGQPKRGMYLVSRTEDRPIVMDFTRHGFAFAQPRFRRDGLMVTASELAVKEVPYRDHIVSVDHADARLIAAAPELLAVLEKLDAFQSFYAEQSRSPGRMPGNDYYSDLAMEIVTEGRAAVAKARGEQVNA